MIFFTPSNVSVEGVCNRCPLGTSRGANSSEGCSLCAAQSYADELGLEECKPCPSRSSQAWNGWRVAWSCDMVSLPTIGFNVFSNRLNQM